MIKMNPRTMNLYECNDNKSGSLKKENILL